MEEILGKFLKKRYFRHHSCWNHCNYARICAADLLGISGVIPEEILGDNRIGIFNGISGEILDDLKGPVRIPESLEKSFLKESLVDYQKEHLEDFLKQFLKDFSKKS